MKLQIILRYVGIALVSVALLMAVSGSIALYVEGDDSSMPLFLSAYITFITGIFPLIFTKHSSELSTKEAYLIVSLSWVAVCIFGMLPYLCYSSQFSVIDALFESVSGFTTTGASILNDIESLPKGLLFWRASTAWVGGFGIVTIFSLIIPKGRDTKSVLSRAEMSDIAKSQAAKKGKSFILGMLSIYIVLTLACTISLNALGMPWFDAITNAMCTCSTCGFCIRNNSIAYYDSPAIEYVLSAFMVFAAISFVAIFSALCNKGFTRFLKSSVLKSFFAIILTCTLLITFDLAYANDFKELGETFRIALFQVCSIITTTGYATTDTTTWPALSIILICIASIICGCSGSTSGGIKMDRAVILWKDLIHNIKKLFSPRKVGIIRMDGKMISDSTITETKSFVLLYLVTLLIGALLNTMCGMDFSTGVSSSIACLGNVGPGFGDVGSMGNYSSVPAVSKCAGMLLMIAGRLEIIPILFAVGALKRPSQG